MSEGWPLPAGDLERVIVAVGDAWVGLKGKTLLITGATGFFGRWMIESLLAANDRMDLGVSILALSRDPGAFLARAPHLLRGELQWITGSVATLSPAALGAREIDSVVHLATEADLVAAARDPRAAADVIVGGTRRVLDAASTLGARRFLFTSSGAAYGRQPPGVASIPESFEGIPDPGDEKNPYASTGEAKRQAELLCESYARDGKLGAVIARCFTFGGPALPLESKFAFGNFMANAMAGQPIVIKGDGTQVRSYLYASDLATWLWGLLLRGSPGRRYNVGSENPVSMKGLAEVIASELGASRIEIRGEANPDTIPERYVPSTVRAREELGLRESFNLPDIVRRTAAWHRGNRGINA